MAEHHADSKSEIFSLIKVIKILGMVVKMKPSVLSDNERSIFGSFNKSIVIKEIMAMLALTRGLGRYMKTTIIMHKDSIQQRIIK